VINNVNQHLIIILQTTILITSATYRSYRLLNVLQGPTKLLSITNNAQRTVDLIPIQLYLLRSSITSVNNIFASVNNSLARAVPSIPAADPGT